MNARRYQLRKDALAIIARGHPWVFRDQLSTAATVFRDGQWLRLVGGDNAVIGYGLYEADGAIAIRVLRRGGAAPDAAWLRDTIAAAVAKRASLVEHTTGLRLVNGESDGLPAVVADRFGDTIVVASYSAGADALARYAAHYFAVTPSPIVGPARHVIVRPARRRHADALPARVIRGAPPEVARFREDAIDFAVDLIAGHKTGAYLDLRGLRRAVAASSLAGARVLNLFSYTGMLGRAAEGAGAAEITHVDESARALAFGAAHHVVDPARHRFVEGDAFGYLATLDPAETFDLIIVDPPSMTSRIDQVPGVLAAYRKLYTATKARVRPGGAIVAVCCTSRVERVEFRRTVGSALGGALALESELAPELDHPVGFPQADYLKITVWRAGR